MFKSWIIAAGLVWSIQSAAASAEAAYPRVFSPSANWTADFAKDSCGLQRSFASGDDRVTVEFRNYGIGSTHVRMISDTLVRGEGAVSTRFSPTGAAQERLVEQRIVAADGRRGADYAEELPEDGSTIQTYLVQGVFRPDVELVTGPLTGMMAVMRSCEDDLLTSIGLQPDQVRSESEHPKPASRTSLIRATTGIAPQMQRENLRRLMLRLLIDVEGRASACELVDGSASTDLASQACRAVERLEFKPALDAAGQPTASMTIVELTARW